MSSVPESVRRVREVFRAFLVLGLTSFGGPVAHLGYFRTEFVARRRWLSEQHYADLVALCQFLPGPASSQVGFALGLLRAGPLGAAAAWLAFTLPSAVILILFAYGSAVMQGPLASGLIHGLKVVAVAIVAHAIWGMAKNLCPDRARATIALLAVVTVIAVSGPGGQVLAIALGALAGLWWCRHAVDDSAESLHFPVSVWAAHLALGLFAVLLVALPLLAWWQPNTLVTLTDSFYRAGALVFGGGHVVLPLLEAEMVQPGLVTPDSFLAGYGAAQAIPGPLFTFAAYLGAVTDTAYHGLVGAGVALVAIFMPGFLLLIAILPHWNRFRQFVWARAFMAGASAAVVGVLGAALYQPVFTSAIPGPYEFALALTGFILLNTWKCPPWLVVLALALGGLGISLLP